MSGANLLFDTNTIIYLLRGDTRFSEIDLRHSRIHLSIISVIEYLSFSGLSDFEKTTFYGFCKEVEIIGLVQNPENELIKSTIFLRNKYKLKMPDAIIAATSLTLKAYLVTADSDLLKISEIKTIPI